MLNDEHFKVLFYEQDSSKVFNNTDIKGGVVISYRSLNDNYGAIGTFTPYLELNAILKKALSSYDFKSMSEIVITRTAYRLTDKMHQDYPEAISILGRINNQRTYKYVRRDYVNDVANLDKYKVFMPGANGNGTFGEVISSPMVVGPRVGSTETFISVGAYNTELEAEYTLKYIKTKFARAMLNILKATQANTPDKWKYVPLQDFTENSDINWSKSIAEIDQIHRNSCKGDGLSG